MSNTRRLMSSLLIIGFAGANIAAATTEMTERDRAFWGATPLLMQVQGVTQDQKATQGVLAFTEAAAYIKIRSALRTLTGVNQDMKALKEARIKLNQAQAELNITSSTLEKVRAGEIAIADKAAQLVAVNAAEEKLGVLLNEYAETEKQLNELNKKISGLPPEQVEPSVRANLATLNERAIALQSVAIPEATASVQVAKQTVIAQNQAEAIKNLEAEKAAKNQSVKALEANYKGLNGGFIKRLTRLGFRVVDGVMVPVIVFDVGARAYLVTLEGVNPGLFPTADITAQYLESQSYAELKGRIMRIYNATLSTLFVRGIVPSPASPATVLK